MAYLEISGECTSECDDCHREAVGIWYEDMETGVEWFICNSCQKLAQYPIMREGGSELEE